MFADLDIEMPALTMGVMNVSKWTASHWYVILAVVVAVVIIYRLVYGTENRLHQDEDPALWQADCQKCLRTVRADNEYSDGSRYFHDGMS